MVGARPLAAPVIQRRSKMKQLKQPPSFSSCHRAHLPNVNTNARPTPKPTMKPYIDNEMDKKKLFTVVSVIDGDTIDVSIRVSALIGH
jgi:hypothetical protein